MFFSPKCTLKKQPEMTTDMDFSGLSKSQTLAWKPVTQLSSKFVEQAILSKKDFNPVTF